MSSETTRRPLVVGISFSRVEAAAHARHLDLEVKMASPFEYSQNLRRRSGPTGDLAQLLCDKSPTDRSTDHARFRLASCDTTAFIAVARNISSITSAPILDRRRMRPAFSRSEALPRRCA
jgi:hypothetical protein